MSDDLKGIFFNNGLQAIGTVVEDGDFYNITGLLQIIIQRDKDGNPVVSFTHLNPFVDEKNIGVDVRVHASAAFLYEIASDIKDAYYQSTNRIQPVSAGALSQLHGR